MTCPNCGRAFGHLKTCWRFTVETPRESITRPAPVKPERHEPTMEELDRAYASKIAQFPVNPDDVSSVFTFPKESSSRKMPPLVGDPTKTLH